MDDGHPDGIEFLYSISLLVLFILLGVRRAIRKQKLLHKSILRCDCLQLAEIHQPWMAEFTP